MDCSWFKANHCRSCGLLEMTYAESLAHKELFLRRSFGTTPSLIKKTIGMSSLISASRNKAKLAVKLLQDNEIAFGFYDEKLIFKRLESCPLHLEGLNDLLCVLKKYFLEFRIFPYDLQSKKGELKYVILSKSKSHNEFLIRFILRSKESLDRLKKMGKKLTMNYSSVRVLTANIQPEHKAILEGEEEIILSEEKFILHQFGNVKLFFGARSFFQVTPEIAQRLYEVVEEIIKKEKIQSFLDLFCGVGAFSFFAAKACPRVLGVELSKEAIHCAIKSIPLNERAGDIAFSACDVENFLDENKDEYQAILVNPPRRGLNDKIIKNIILNSPEYIFYSSCNLETLERDLSKLKYNYNLIYIQLFDMFPYTEHFETLVVLKKISNLEKQVWIT